MSQRRPTTPAALPALSSLLALMALLVVPGARAAAQSSPSGGGARATISGAVFDSLAGKPLADALVQVVARGRDEATGVWSVKTGADGAFQLSGVGRGRYLVGFMHPALDSLGLDVPPHVLEVTDASPVHVDLAIPSAGAIRGQLCPESQPGDSTGLVLGIIRNADTGMPVANGTVVVMWTELVVGKAGISTDQRQVPVKANSNGWYALCGVPSDGPLIARAERGDDATGYIEIRVPPRGLLHLDFGIPAASAAVAVADTGLARGKFAGVPLRHGTARVTGVVRNEQGKPLAGAQLLVWGSGVTGSTDGGGTFLLTGLPAGTQSLEIRYVGYSPKRVTVNLASGVTRSVAVTLDERADVLGEVTVYGKPSRRRKDLTGFLERHERGMGYFITRDDIQSRHPFQFTDLMRTVPGLRVVPSSYLDYSIISSHGTSMGGACKPQIYVDGTRLIDGEQLNAMIQPSDIAGVEIYNSSESPPQYSSGLCGSILIWTGRGV